MQTLHFDKYRVCDCPKQTPFLWYFGWVRNSLHYIECPPTRRVSNKLLKGVLSRLVCFLYTPKSIHDCHVSDFAQDFTPIPIPMCASQQVESGTYTQSPFLVCRWKLRPVWHLSEGWVANHSNWTLFWKTKLKDQRFKVKMMELTLLMSVTMFAMAMKAGAFLPDYWGPDTRCLHVRWVCWRLSSKDKEQGLRAVVQKMLFVSVLMNVPENVK